MESYRARIGELTDLLSSTKNIRNICILAHVDHGKTTLSDSLVCSNGFISNKLAGKLRFLDSTEDEQKRGITMHSSAISLLYRAQEAGKKLPAPPAEAPAPIGSDYLINLVDSPGHIDFSSDVSTAARLCDGALLVVDVLEGVCTQTHAVLYKALKEGLTPCLVLNKIDRLALELQLTPLEALHHLRRIIENVNALASTLLRSESLVSETRKYDLEKLQSPEAISASTPAEEAEDGDSDCVTDQWQFAPEKGNVVFSSAIDCWGFGTLKFANIWAKKLGVNKNVLYKYMFEDYYFNNASKKICKCDSADSSHVPMAVPLIFEPIWRLYNICVTEKDTEKAAKMAERGLGVMLAPREINQRDPRGTLQTIFQKWIPLSEAVLRMVVRCVPSPDIAQGTKESSLFGDMAITEQLPTAPGHAASSRRIVIDRALAGIARCKEGVKNCAVDLPSDASSPVVVFISKMMPIKLTDLAPEDANMIRLQRRLRAAEALAQCDDIIVKVAVPEDESDVLMALGRVFSGTLTRMSSYYVLNHRHRPLTMVPPLEARSEDEWASIAALEGSEMEAAIASGRQVDTISSTVSVVPRSSIGLYLCFGPSIKSVPFIPAGNIVGIIGLDQQVLKTGTLSSSFFCPPMRPISFQAKPILRVAVEPTRHQDLATLEAGLKLLYQYDPVVEVAVEATGEFTISCLGELHLELCLKALSESFAKCEVKVSPPLVPYRETVAQPATSEFLRPLCDTPAASLIGAEGTEIVAGLDPVHYLPAPWVDTPGLDKVRHGQACAVAGNGNLSISLSCSSIPPLALAYLMELSDQDLASSEQSTLLVDRTMSKQIEQVSSAMSGQGLRCLALVLETATSVSINDKPDDFRHVAQATWAKLSHLLSPLSSVDSSDTDLSFKQLISLGPDTKGPNLLMLSKNMRICIWKSAESMPLSQTSPVDADVLQAPSISLLDGLIAELDPFLGSKEACDLFQSIWSRLLRHAIVTGFQVTCAHGPMMEEPLQGVCFFVNNVDISCSELPRDILEQLQQMLSRDTSRKSDAFSATTVLATTNIMAGHLIPEVKNTMRNVMMGSNMRVVEPVFSCSVQCDQSQLGNLYAVLAKRRGDVTHEDIIEGTSLFLLSAMLPVSNSFGFAQELLKKTSGKAVTPQLVFSHWGTISLDPFWKPTTGVELEDHGGQAVVPNVGRNFINDVRKRKGLPLEEKIVVAAEKQRNLTKNK